MANLSDKATTAGVPDASPSQDGLVTTGTQSFAGAKTFEGEVTVTNSSGLSLNPGAGASAQLIFKENDTVMWQAYNSQADDSFKLYQGAGGGVALSVDTSRNFDFQSGNLTTAGQLDIRTTSGQAANFGTAAPADHYISLKENGLGGFFGWDDSANLTILQAAGSRQLSFQVNSNTFSAGTEAMRIDSSGNVTVKRDFTVDDGAGKFTVDSDSGSGIATLEGTNPQFYLIDTDGDDAIMSMNAGDFRISLGGTTYLEMNSTNGTLGVGVGATAAAANSNQLQVGETGFTGVLGSGWAGSFGAVQNGVYINTESTSTGHYPLFVRAGDNTENVLICRADGRIGMGTDAPEGNLHVGETTANTATYIINKATSKSGLGAACIYRSFVGSTSYWDAGTYNNGSNNAGYMLLRDAGGPNFRYFYMDSSGNFRGSSTASNIGTSGGSLVGGPTTSDARLKENITTTNKGLEAVLALNPVEYNYTYESAETPRIGFLAQEVENIVPESVYRTGDERYGVENTYAMESQQLIPVLVKAIQELKEEVDALKNA